MMCYYLIRTNSDFFQFKFRDTQFAVWTWLSISNRIIYLDNRRLFTYNDIDNIIKSFNTKNDNTISINSQLNINAQINTKYVIFKGFRSSIIKSFDRKYSDIYIKIFLDIKKILERYGHQ